MHVEVFDTTEVPGHDADETLGRIPGCCMGFEHFAPDADRFSQGECECGATDHRSDD